MSPTRVASLKHHAACLGVAIALAAALKVLVGYIATYATLAIESGSELSTVEMVLIASGYFIARWYVVIVALLVGAALVIARRIGRRGPGEASGPGP